MFPTMSKAADPPTLLPVIDALRGLAALAVVLHHVRVNLWVGWRQIWNHPDSHSVADKALSMLAAPTPLMGAGVMLFFVISGFCIHLPYAGARDLHWGTYLLRRTLRILPPYWAAIGLTWVAEAVVAHGAQQPVSSLMTTVRSVLMIQNYGPSAGQMVGNPSLWSLPVEMELYLVYPVLLLMFRRLGLWAAGSVVVTVGLLATLAHLTGHGAWCPKFSGYWLIWSGGALLAHTWSSGVLPRFPLLPSVVVILALLASAIWGHLHGWAVGVKDGLWGGAFLFSIMILLDKGWALPGQKFLVAVGKRSYSLYLIHFPLFVVLGTGWERLYAGKPVSFLVPLAASVVALAGAWIFYRWVEYPSHLLAVRLGRRQPPGSVLPDRPVS